MTEKAYKEKSCKWCSASFISSRKKYYYCSDECSNNFRNKQRAKYRKKYSEMTEEQKEKKRENCRRYYYRNHEKQKERVKEGYHKWLNKFGREHVKKAQQKASARRRFGIDDREGMLKQAGYNCQNVYCKGRGKTLHIHHVDNEGRRAMQEGRSPNNDPDNLMVICSSCHQAHHRWNHRVQKKV